MLRYRDKTNYYKFCILDFFKVPKTIIEAKVIVNKKKGIDNIE